MTTALALPAELPAPLDRLDTLPPFPVDGSVLTLAPQIVHWAESLLIQPNGPRAGKPFQFTPRQLRFLMWWYGVDDDGAWLFQHGARRLAKGSGKSPFAGVLGLCEFCGPVRVHDIDHKRRIVVGKPFTMPLVQIAATAESQTGNTMRMVRAFAPKGSPIVVQYNLDPGKVKYYRLPEGKLEVISSSPTAAEGAEPSLIIADETEHWRPANGGVELNNTLLDNLAKSASRMLETNNAWIPGRDSVAETTFDAWVAQEEGLMIPESGLILYDAIMSRPDLDWYDPVAVRTDLERIYADCWWQNLGALMGRIYNKKAKLSDSKRKYGNRPEVAEDAWIEPEQWVALRALRKVEDGESIVMFFDGSKSRDATALIGCCMSDGHVFRLGVWEPPKQDHTANSNRKPGQVPKWVVPVAEVDAKVRWARDVYDVVGFFSDVREWESFAKIEWPKLFGDELLAEAVPGGKDPQKIAWDMSGHLYEFTRACELTHAEIEDKLFTQDGDAAIARHAGNARNRPNKYGTSIGKAAKDSPDKIDSIVCVIGARMVRRLVLASPKWKKRRKKTRASFFS
jgi:hypothetical protein